MYNEFVISLTSDISMISSEVGLFQNVGLSLLRDENYFTPRIKKGKISVDPIFGHANLRIGRNSYGCTLKLVLMN